MKDFNYPITKVLLKKIHTYNILLFVKSKYMYTWEHSHELTSLVEYRVGGGWLPHHEEEGPYQKTSQVAQVKQCVCWPEGTAYYQRPSSSLKTDKYAPTLTLPL